MPLRVMSPDKFGNTVVPFTVRVPDTFSVVVDRVVIVAFGEKIYAELKVDCTERVVRVVRPDTLRVAVDRVVMIAFEEKIYPADSVFWTLAYEMVVREFEDVIPGATNAEETERDVKDSVVITAFGEKMYVELRVDWTERVVRVVRPDTLRVVADIVVIIAFEEKIYPADSVFWTLAYDIVVTELEDMIPGAANAEETERDVKDRVVMTAFGAYR
jgi:hypothetical protein